MGDRLTGYGDVPRCRKDALRQVDLTVSGDDNIAGRRGDRVVDLRIAGSQRTEIRDQRDAARPCGQVARRRQITIFRLKVYVAGCGGQIFGRQHQVGAGNGSDGRGAGQLASQGVQAQLVDIGNADRCPRAVERHLAAEIVQFACQIDCRRACIDISRRRIDRRSRCLADADALEHKVKPGHIQRLSAYS